MKINIIATISWFLAVIGTVSPRLAGKIATHFFSVPSTKAKLRINESKIMDRAQISELIVNDKLVKVYQWGDGEKPVLMLHGWESRASRFAAFVPVLVESGFSPVTFDAPGHGDSEGDTTNILEYELICQEIAKNTPKFAAIIGHSFGSLCMFYGLRSGISANCAVAISGVCDFRYTLDVFTNVLRLTPRVVQNLESRVEQFFMPVVNDFWQRFSVTYNNAEDILIPVCVIHDEADDVVNLSQAVKVHQVIGEKANLHITKKLGHHRILRNQSVVHHAVNFISGLETNQH